MPKRARKTAGTTTVILGAQWGDEGKGKLVDILAKDADVCARCQGGSNAGHTIVVGDKKFAFHLIPSGVLYDSCTCVVGNGVVIHFPTLFKELKDLKDKGVNYEGRLLISDRAHVLFDLHQTVDRLREEELGGMSIGTTHKGIGPCYSTKAIRSGIRVADLMHFKSFEADFKALVDAQVKRYGPKLVVDVEAEIKRYREIADVIRPMVVDSVSWVNKQYNDGKHVLIEGANATMLDIDFGTYPFVTSSNASVGGCCTGLGIAPSKINDVIGVVKSYTTRVGSGPFPTELTDELGDALVKIGGEFGTTTGRKRRCGWFDAVVVRYTHLINNYNSINLTKLDVLDTFKVIKIAVAYKDGKGRRLDSFPASLDDLANVTVEYEDLPGWEADITGARKWSDLPKNCQNYINRIAEVVGCPVKYIGVGPARDALIVC